MFPGHDPKGFTQVPALPWLLSPTETLLLFGDSLSQWEGMGLCWEETASLGGARAGSTLCSQAAVSQPAPQPTPFLPTDSSPLPLCWQGP